MNLDLQVIGRLTGSGSETDPAVRERLRARLVAGAERQSLLDLAYRTVDSPVGSLLLAATPEGVVRIAFDCEGHDAVLGDLAQRVSPRILRAPGRLEGAARQLEEYFAGRRRHFDVRVDLRLASGFRREVLEHLPSIAYGTTESYTMVAAASGRPAAVRAVGSACATNPLPLVLPCHRVVRHDGAIGQYRGGAQAKAALLAMEGA